MTRPLSAGMLCLVVALAVAAPAAAETVALEQKDLTAVEPQVLSMVLRWSFGDQQSAAQTPNLPEGLKGEVYYGNLSLAGHSVPVAMSVTDTAKLYVDTDGDGKLAGETPLDGELKGGFRCFGPFTVQLGKGPDGRNVSLFVRHQEGTPYFQYGPGVYHEGAVELGGLKRRIAVMDSDWSGKIGRGEFTMQAVSSRNFDGLAVDLDGDGRFSMSMANYELMPLPRMVLVADAWYTVEVKPDGTSITLTKIEPKMATLDAGSPDAEFMLIGDTGFHYLKGQGGKWQLPEGNYLIGQIVLAKTDEAGVKWSLNGQPKGDESAMLKLKAGQTVDMKLSGPLVAEVDTEQSDEAVSIGLSLVGPGGIQFAPGATKGNQRQPAPTFKILDEKGKELAADKFAYG